MVYAEDVNFWKTSRTSPDEWISKAKKQIQNLGGTIKAEGFGSDGEGKAVFMLGFEIEGEGFKIIWPVLDQRYEGGEKPARIQAATMLYHYVKAVCLYAVVVGVRTAFFAHLMLPGGKTTSQATNEEFMKMMPQLSFGQKLICIRR